MILTEKQIVEVVEKRIAQGNCKMGDVYNAICEAQAAMTEKNTLNHILLTHPDYTKHWQGCYMIARPAVGS